MRDRGEAPPRFFFSAVSTSTARHFISIPTGPRPVPLLGNALIVFMVRPNDMINRLLEFDYYGKVVRAFLGPMLYVFILDARDIEIILGSHVHIDKSSEYR